MDEVRYIIYVTHSLFWLNMLGDIVLLLCSQLHQRVLDTFLKQMKYVTVLPDVQPNL